MAVVGWRKELGVKSILEEEALSLSRAMKLVRGEEQSLADQGDAAKQTISFLLPSDGGARVQALRAVVAARIYNGALLGGKQPQEVVLDEESEAETSLRQNASSDAGGDIVLEGVSKVVLQIVLDFVYAADFELEDATVHQVLEAASLLRLHGAVAVCTAFLAHPSKCTVETVGKILASADKCRATKLKEQCLKYIDEHTAGVLSNATFHPAPPLFREVLSRDGLAIDELELFRYVMEWAKREHIRRKAEQEQQPEPQEGEGGARGKATLSSCLCGDGVIDQVRFALIAPEQLRDTVQPMLTRQEGEEPEGAVEGGQGTYLVPEQLLLEAYQHHALVAIGQASQVAPERTRERALKHKPRREPPHARAGAEGDGGWKERVRAARQAAARTEAWLEGLPEGAQRVSMSGMGLGLDDAVLVSDWLRGRGRAGLVELDLKANSVQYEGLGLLLDGLRACSRLRGLALGQNPLGRGGSGGALGRRLGEALRGGGALSRVEKLGLGGTELTDEDSRELAAALAGKDHRIQVLGLSGNFIGRAGARALVQSQEGRAGPVHTLVLSQNRIDAAEFPELRALAHPGLSLKL